jgi:hypothetical protein
MGKIVCVLRPTEAQAFEQDGRIPNCDHHTHVSSDKADLFIAAFRDTKGMMVEGHGSARSVRGVDGRRRITPLPRILRFTSIPEFYVADGARGVTTMRPVYASGVRDPGVEG